MSLTDAGWAASTLWWATGPLRVRAKSKLNQHMRQASTSKRNFLVLANLAGIRGSEALHFLNGDRGLTQEAAEAIQAWLDGGV